MTIRGGGQNASSNESEVHDRSNGSPNQPNSRRSHRTSDMRGGAAVFSERLLNSAQKLGQQLQQALNYLMVDLGGYELFDRFVQWCVRHPQIATCLMAGIVVMLLPFLLVLGFGLSTIVMTFTGFLVLEGTILTIVSMLLFGLLGATVLVFVFFGIIGIAAYFGVAHIYGLFGNVERHRTAVLQFLRQPHNTPKNKPPTSHPMNSGDEIVTN